METNDTLKNLRMTLRGIEPRWGEIAKKGRITRQWIAMFARGAIDNPGVKTLAKVRRGIELIPAEPPRKHGGLTSARKRR